MTDDEMFLGFGFTMLGASFRMYEVKSPVGDELHCKMDNGELFKIPRDPNITAQEQAVDWALEFA